MGEEDRQKRQRVENNQRVELRLLLASKVRDIHGSCFIDVINTSIMVNYGVIRKEVCASESLEIHEEPFSPPYP